MLSAPCGCNSSRRSRLAALLATFSVAMMLIPWQAMGNDVSTPIGRPDDWPTAGRSISENRFSPLADINEKNVGQLSLAWTYKVYPDRGMEATPVVIGGVMYTTGPFSIVYALDAATGSEIWRYDPKVDRGNSNYGCCDVVNRGVAVSDGRVFVGTFDGRLLALDEKSGELLWSVDTIIDRNRNYTITGTPWIAHGKVIIGNGGSEFGTRGYITAYGTTEGKHVWRFFTVPGALDAPDANTKAVKLARGTWYGDTYIKEGGGGSVWDSMAYDPVLNLLYIGVANGSKWNRNLSSQGKGDNLFVASIVALNPDTGAYVWHYQETPGEEWDYDATENMILADLTINGKARKTLMQAPKNGFFYVIDRRNGKLISANNFVPVNWAKAIDKKSGRPVFDENAARYEDGKLKLVMPAMVGAHNWQPMSFNPLTGLVYIPAQLNAAYYKGLPNPELPKQLGMMDFGVLLSLGPKPTENGPAPKDDEIPDLTKPAEVDRVKKSWTGKLVAWDPVKQQAVWSRDHANVNNGGTLSTAGNLVFQGTADGRFCAYRASDGAQLWQTPANTGVMAAPMTYRVNGEQYVAVSAGWGGSFGLSLGPLAQRAGVQTDARVLVYKIGGTASLPAPKPPLGTPPVLTWDGDRSTLATSDINFQIHCVACHGIDAIGGGEVPDLRYLGPAIFNDSFSSIVNGALASEGMPDFSKKLNASEIEGIRQYVAKRNLDLRDELGGNAR